MSKAKAIFSDAEEKELIESFESALESGEVRASPDAHRAKAGAEWEAVVAKSSARKAITLRLQERDIERLKVIARQRGLPYQTLVSSVLHQFALGALREGRD
jgi:predicted DNA binding CopG/RHH family protein